MRAIEGVPNGRIVELHNPGKIREREEVIVFKRDDFARTFTSIMKQIDSVNKVGFSLDKTDEWKLIGYWPRIMKNVHMIDLHMDLLFEKEPLQSHLDAYIYNNIPSSKKKIALSENEAITIINSSDLNLLLNSGK